MHAFEGKNGTRFFFNGDYSDIRIVNPGKSPDEEIELEPEDFMAFARMAIGDEVISLVEDHFC